MSITSWAQTPTPALTAEQFPSILAGLILAQPIDRSVLTILGLAAVDRLIAGRGADQPRAALRLDATLLSSIEARGVIYPLRQPLVGNDYYVEYIRERHTLWLKYQQIIGSRLLIALTPSQATQFELAVHGLCAPPPDASPAESTLVDEMGMLTVHGRRIELPTRQLAHYPRIKALIQAAGGTYTRNGFTFGPGCDANALLMQLRAGEQPNPKKDRQAFFTPEPLAFETVALAGDLSGRRVLEPSAGEGALADAARGAGAEVLAIENHALSAQILRDKGHKVIERDFLSVSPSETGLFDAVIANPPFTGNQDIAHVTHMWRFLRPEGVLISLLSPGWRGGRSKAQREFREFAEKVHARVEVLPAGAFKTAGTNATVLRIHMVKPLEAGALAAHDELVT